MLNFKYGECKFPDIYGVKSVIISKKQLIGVVAIGIILAGLSFLSGG